MARLPILQGDGVADPDLKCLFHQTKGLGLEKFSHQLGILAHHPPLLGAITHLFEVYYRESVVPRKYLEMAILVVSFNNRCDYCVVHHTPLALDAGLTQPQVAAIEGRTWNDGGSFDETERTVLDFALQVSQRGGRVAESTFAALKETFTEQQLVELAVRTSMCEFFNRFNEIFQLENEGVAEVLFQRSQS